MASLEALGLASNIVQFIDFTSKLVMNARTLYKSAHQTSTGGLVLQNIADDLTRLSNSVTVSNRPEEEGLKQLAQSAKEFANDLLSLLDDMKIKGRKTKWKSFIVAIKEVRNQEAVTSITSSITRLQTQMTLHIQFQIRHDIASLSKDIQRLQSRSDRLQLNNATELEKLRADLLGAFNAMKTASKHQHDRHGQNESSIMLDFERLTIDDFHAMSQRLPNYASKVSAISQDIGAIEDDQDFIKSFYFGSFAAREERISQSHAQTFEWIFSEVLPDEKTKVGFSNWLQSGNGIFWVRGKAGSGKSTLMKFICHHRSTLQHLQHWSGPQQLIIGRFYFWNSGTDLQKSQEGLLRSLIFEILRQCPELATHAKANLSYRKGQPDLIWLSGSNDDRAFQDRSQGQTLEDWTFLQLTEILGKILSHDESKRFFFAIDGLDEYKAQYTQDHQGLINALKGLVVSPHIKICVSSRPWTVFMDAFDGDFHHCLKLEDLTRDDIRSYVMDKFFAHNQYDKLIQMDSNYSSLVEEVVQKADGVFLWVFLIVRELLDGLTYNDGLSTMRQRLESFPDTLEEFFQHMLDSVPKLYRPQTAQIFQVSVSCPHPLPMLYYSLLGNINDDPDLTAQEAPRPLYLPEFLQRQDTMQRRLDAWCKGLLEIVNPITKEDPWIYTTPRVDFLHRSVQDFIKSGNVTAMSERTTFERRHTWLQFCNAIILLIRRIAVSKFESCGVGLDTVVRFAGEAQKDGACSHTVTKIMLEACDAMALWEPGFPDLLSDRDFILEAMSYGLKDFITAKVMSAREAVISYFMEYCLVKSCSSEMISLLISCAGMKGLSSKAVFEDPFKSFIALISKKPELAKHRLRANEILDKIKVIASTGYQLDDGFIKTNFPDYYMELRHVNFESKEKKRGLEECGEESERKKVRTLS